jgi:hypothetical protein
VPAVSSFILESPSEIVQVDGAYDCDRPHHGATGL